MDYIGTPMKAWKVSDDFYLQVGLKRSNNQDRQIVYWYGTDSKWLKKEIGSELFGVWLEGPFYEINSCNTLEK